MKFDNETDYLEWIATTHGIIGAFQGRGYALYQIGAADSAIFISSKELLEQLIAFGPAEDVLELEFRYIPLPLVAEGQRDDPKAVMAAVDCMTYNMRGPYFVDLQSHPDGSVEPMGSHLVDSIFVESPNLCMVIDSRFGSGRKGNIELPLATAAHQISGQLMLALRTNSIPSKKQDKMQ